MSLNNICSQLQIYVDETFIVSETYYKHNKLKISNINIVNHLNCKHCM